jgi:transcriptional regulator with XRE-family HTH domain
MAIKSTPKMYREIGVRLQEARLAYAERQGTKVSQQDVAKALGWASESQSRLSQYESGVRKISIPELVKLSELYGADPCYIAFGKWNLPEAESTLLRDYRVVGDEARRMVRAILNEALKVSRETSKKAQHPPTPSKAEKVVLRKVRTDNS